MPLLDDGMAGLLHVIFVHARPFGSQIFLPWLSGVAITTEKDEIKSVLVGFC